MGLKERFYVDMMAVHPGVTGSCCPMVVKYPNGETTKFIVDCGMFQEKEYAGYNQKFPFDADKIDFCVVTHNHIDHTGRLPLLVKEGFNKKIYLTQETRILLPLALYDSYKVVKDLAKRNHVSELYSEANVSETIRNLQACSFGVTECLDEHIKVTFFKNGHLIGAAIILIQISFPGYDDINLLFTGDYNDKNIFFEIEELPSWVRELPLTVVQESTYGRMDSNEKVVCFEENVSKCIQNNGTAVCMAFSLGRFQEILHKIKQMQDQGTIGEDINIYADGNLGIKYTHLYIHAELGIKEEMKDFLPKNLTFVDKSTRDEILNSTESKIIITTSGMGTYGPAQLYIPEYITKPNALIQFTGYTAEGTMGKMLRTTAKGEKVFISGILLKKHAIVAYTTEFSAHAKADEMILFLKKFKNLKLVLVNHGEIETKLIFSERIIDEIGPKHVAVLGRDYLYRVGPYGLIRSLTTKFE